MYHHSAAITHIQSIHPSIDCPIVIPNGDYDPMKATTSPTSSNDDDEVTDRHQSSRHDGNKRSAHSSDLSDASPNKKFKCKIFKFFYLLLKMTDLLV